MRIEFGARRLALLTVAAALTVAGCGGGSSRERETGASTSGASASATTADGGAAPQRGGAVTILRASDIDGWDPDKTIQLTSFETLPQVMEGLVRVGADGRSIEPGLAESWRLDPRRRTITFKLRRGVTFSDGRPVTSADAAFSVDLWRRGRSMGSLYQSITGTETPDPHTLVIRLSRPSTFTLTFLSNGSSVVLPEDFGGRSRRDFFAAPIGAGPFVVDHYRPGQQVVLRRNERYYDPERPYLDQITYDVVSDPNQQLLRFQSGQADMIEGVPVDLASQIPDDSRLIVHPSATIHGIFVNAAKAPGDDIHFRRAISLALDRDRYIDAVFGGMGAVAEGGLPPRVQGSVGCGCRYETDLEEARAELARSSYRPGTPVEMVVDATSPASTRAGEVAAAQLREIGIDVDLQKLEVQVMVDRQAKGEYDLSLGEVSSVSPTVGDIFGLIVATDGLYSGLSMRTISEAFDRLDVAQTDRERGAATRIAEEWIHENLPYVPVAYPDRLFAVAPRIRGVTVTPFLSYPADRMWVVEG